MILKKLHIDNFGAFHDYEMELHEGLNVLSRPNEFGKTTILEFIRRIFWGFPDKRSRANLYPQLHGTGAYGGWIEVVMRSGEVLKLERRGERGALRVIDKEGRITEGPDIRILSNCSEHFYNNIGAITIDELNEAGTLNDGEIRTRLYGGGLNDSNIPIAQIRKELQRRADEIYTKTGSRNKMVKQAQEFAESNSKLGIAATHLELFRKALKNAEVQEQTAAQVRKKLESARKKHADLQNQNRSALQWRDLQHDEAELKKQTLPPQPESPEVPELLKLNCDIRRARPVEETVFSRIAALQNSRAETVKKIAELPPDLVLSPPPNAPRPSDTLQNFCTPDSAQKVEQADLDLAQSISGKRETVLKFWKTTRSLPFISFGMALLTGTALVAGLVMHWGFLVLALIPLAAAVALVEINKKLEKKIQLIRDELQQIVPDLAYRFALNPALSQELCYPVLKQLQEFQALQPEYEKAMADYERIKQEFNAAQNSQNRIKAALNQELKQIEDEFQQLYFACAVQPGFPQEKLQELLKTLQEFQGKDRKYAQQKALYDQAAAEYRQKEQKLAARREMLIAEYGLAPAEAVSAELLEQTESDVNELNRKLEQTLFESGGFRREAERLRQLSDTVDELNIREQIRGQMVESARECLLYRAALLLLDRTVARGEREHQGAVLQQGSALFAEFTGNRYTKIFKSIESGELFVIDSVSGLEKKIQELSRGTKEQLLLALRLALIASFETENEPLPVILDDVLVNFDRLRQAAVRRGLEKFSTNRQILLLSAER